MARDLRDVIDQLLVLEPPRVRLNCPRCRLDYVEAASQWSGSNLEVLQSVLEGNAEPPICPSCALDNEPGGGEPMLVTDCPGCGTLVPQRGYVPLVVLRGLIELGETGPLCEDCASKAGMPG